MMNATHWFKRRLDSVAILPETDFRAILAWEMKRCERSGKKCVLAAIGLPPMPAVEKSMNAAAAALRGAVRDIDSIGWYEQGRALGVVFPILSGSDAGCAMGSIRRKIDAILERTVDKDLLPHSTVSLVILPDQQQTGPSISPAKERLCQTSTLASFAKRSIDIIGSIVGVVALSPVFVIIAAAVKFTSRGPVLFRQTRIGKNGLPFTFLKFRSMYDHADFTVHREYVQGFIAGHGAAHIAGDHEVYKLVDDSRVTPLGRLLRRSSLDELPQLINVLKGEMSLIGPRPPMSYEVDHYQAWHSRRLLVKPGITGLWQVSGRCRTTFDDMVRLDLRYVRDWSLRLDLTILLRTPRAVLSGDGAF